MRFSSRQNFLLPATMSSKLSVSSVRGSIKGLLADANGEKKHNFVETIELQIGLKNYDPSATSVSREPSSTTLDIIFCSLSYHLQTPQCPLPAHVHLHSRRCS